MSDVERQYWAFISYSHKDADFGGKLHRQLENYSIPKHLVGRTTARGAVPRRLVPIFRDRDELPAANDLTAEVLAALQASRSLIVLCSPAAAVSPWVSCEVEAFRSLHPDRPVLAAIVEGEPASSFPEAVRAAVDGLQVEPLAADFRPGQDGKTLGLLKLIAGITGLGLDELVQRDAQRRTRRVMAVTAAALIGMLGMTGLAGFALTARNEAVRQRGAAEGLIEFMLTDLRQKLKGVGRLDIMGAVNQRALAYYADQELASLPPASLERRARILHAVGEDDEARGNHAHALSQFREARRTTAALLAESPSDPERIFDHAQSEFWFGYVAYERGQNAEAEKAFVAYRDLTRKAADLRPGEAKYLRELGYADGNLCSVALRRPGDSKQAVSLCGAALRELRLAAKLLPGDGAINDDIVNRLAWLADAYVANGDLTKARAARQEEERRLDGEVANDPRNMSHKADWVALQIALALLDEKTHQPADAARRLKAGLEAVQQMVAFDPTNRQWVSQRSWLERKLRQQEKPAGEPNGQQRN